MKKGIIVISFMILLFLSLGYFIKFNSNTNDDSSMLLAKSQTKYDVKFYGIDIIETGLPSKVVLSGSKSTPSKTSQLLNLTPNTDYVISFDYITTGSKNMFSVGLTQNSSLKQVLTAKVSSNHYDWEVSSDSKKIKKAKLRFIDDYQEENENNIEIKNIMVSTMTKKTKSKNSKLGTLPEPVRDGYKFLGWYTSPTGGDKVTSTTKVKGNMTLYSRWVKEGELAIHFMKTGFYDDGILIKSSETSIFIDGGRGDNEVISYLDALNTTTIDYVIGSHTEYDHIYAQSAVIRKYDVKNVVYANDITHCGCSCDRKDVGAVLEALNEKGMTPQVQPIPSKLELSDMTLYFIAPLKITCNKNDNSFIFILEYGNNKFMFTGDSDSPLHNVNALLANAKEVGLDNINIDLFKYPHHGNAITIDDALIKATGFTTTIVPNYNAPHYPNRYTIERFQNLGIKMYRQSDSKTGNILVKSDGDNITVTMDVNP